MTLVLNSEENYDESQKTQYERKQERVLEYGVREVAQVPEDTARTKDHENASLKKNREKNKAYIHQAIQKLVPFTVAVHEGQTAPEGREAKQVSPKRIVVFRSSVDGISREQNQESKTEGYPQAFMPSKVLFTNQERSQIHRHVPQRKCDWKGKKGKAKNFKPHKPPQT